MSVVNIDQGDSEYPECCVEYVNEIMSYLKRREVCDTVHHLYLCAAHPITERDRFEAVEMIFSVSTKLKLLTETIFLAVALFDLSVTLCFTDLLFFDEADRERSVATVCLWIANKFEENTATDLESIIYAANIGKHNVRPAIETCLSNERTILRSIDYRLARTHPLLFLRRFSKASFSDTKTHTLSKYIAECGATDSCMLRYLPSYIAASAVFIARAMQPEKFPECWSPTLTHYTGCSPATNVGLKKCILDLNRVLRRQSTGKHVCWRRYCKTQLLKVSKMGLISNEDLSALLTVSSVDTETIKEKPSC